MLMNQTPGIYLTFMITLVVIWAVRTGYMQVSFITFQRDRPHSGRGDYAA